MRSKIEEHYQGLLSLLNQGFSIERWSFWARLGGPTKSNPDRPEIKLDVEGFVMTTDELRKHLAGIDALITQGFSVKYFRLGITMANGTEQVEFTIDKAGAGVVNQANRNAYHIASDPEASYLAWKEDLAKKAKVGEQHQESVDMLVPILTALATKCYNDACAANTIKNANWQPKFKDYISTKNHITDYKVWMAADTWRNITVSHNTTTNKFKIFSRGVGYGTPNGKVSKSWIRPQALIENLAKFDALQKALTNPNLVKKEE